MGTGEIFKKKKKVYAAIIDLEKAYKIIGKLFGKF